MKANGRLAVDTNAVIAYREGVDEVCALIDEADVIIWDQYQFGAQKIEQKYPVTLML